MAVRTILTLVALSLSAGCTTAPPASAPKQGSPVFIQYRAGQSARYRLDAPYSGTITQKGPCLGIIREERFSTLIWPETARVDFDRRGFVVSATGGGPRVRVGDYIEFRGGPLPKGMAHGFGEDILSEPMPMACAHYPGYEGWIAIVNPGFRKGAKP